jgi:stress response protein SCP2
MFYKKKQSPGRGLQLSGVNMEGAGTANQSVFAIPSG